MVASEKMSEDKIVIASLKSINIQIILAFISHLKVHFSGFALCFYFKLLSEEGNKSGASKRINHL